MIIPMDINYVLLRQISILSVFFGAVLGAVTLIPYLGVVSFVFLLCLSFFYRRYTLLSQIPFIIQLCYPEG